jgi:hypothetical protein
MKSLTLTSVAAVLFIGVVSSQAQPLDPADGSPRTDPKSAIAPLATGPLQVIYRVTGLTDNGGAANAGVATSFHCYNGGAVPENISFSIRSAAGPVIRVTPAITVASGATFTASTHPTVIFQDAGATQNLATGFIGQGTATIRATNTTVFCTAMIIDAAAANPLGVALHMIRSNPAAGTQE